MQAGQVPPGAVPGLLAANAGLEGRTSSTVMTSEQGTEEQALSGVLIGDYEAAVDIVSVQLAYRFK